MVESWKGDADKILIFVGLQATPLLLRMTSSF
jgi:hypothetical protein